MGLAVIGAEFSNGHIVHIAGVGMASPAHIGPLVIIHHLSDSSRHTTRHSTHGNSIRRGISGTLVIIRATLIPNGRDQWRNGSHTLGGLMGNGVAMGLQVGNLAIHLVHPVLHRSRKVD